MLTLYLMKLFIIITNQMKQKIKTPKYPGYQTYSKTGLLQKAIDIVAFNFTKNYNTFKKAGRNEARY